MDNIIEALQKNKIPVCLMDKQLCGAMLCMDVREFDCLQSTSTIDEPDWSRMDHVSEWSIGEKYNNDYNTYRLREDYKEVKWPDRVFASTTDHKKDSMNNTIAVTAHCNCGNVFCDDVVHGKSQKRSDTEPAGVEKCEVRIGKQAHCLGFLVYVRQDGTEVMMSEASDDPDFIGFLYKCGMVRVDPIAYIPGDDYEGIHHRTEIKGLEAGEIKILHATHVLFSKKT